MTQTARLAVPRFILLAFLAFMFLSVSSVWAAVPVISATAPATNAFINTSKVSYTLDVAATISGTIVFTQTGGSADGNSPHTCALQGTALNAGAHTDLVMATGANACVVWANALVDGAVYTITFDAVNADGPATTVTNTGVTFDTTAPTISSTAPATNAFINTSKVSYSLSEAVSSGAIVFTQTGGSADVNSPHTCALQGTALNTGAHTDLVMATGANACTAWANALVDGAVYTVTFDATDKASNAGATVTNTGVTFDTTAPTISLVSLGADAYVNLADATSGVNIDVTTVGVEDGQTVSCTITDTGAGSVGPVTNTTTTNAATIASTPLTSLADGVITATCSVSDLAGNAATPVIDTATKDVVGPAPNLVSPSGGASTNASNNTFALTYNYTDEISATASCILYMGGAPVASNGTVSNDTQTTVYSNASFTPGMNNWYVNCTDLAGNSNASGTQPFYYDTVAPTVALLSPTTGAWSKLTNNTLAFSFNYTDVFSSTASCTLYIDSVAVAINASIQNDTVSATLYSNSSIAEGARSWTVTCTDNAGNAGGVAANVLNVDRTAPTINLIDPSSSFWDNGTTKTFIFNVTDARSSLMDCMLMIYNVSDYVTSDVNASVLNDTTTTFTASLAWPFEGQHNWGIRCYDGNGTGDLNKADSFGNNVYIDMTPPMINEIYINESDHFVSSTSPNDMVTVIVNATDTDTGTGNTMSYVTINFSALGQGTDLVNATYLSGDLYYAELPVTDVTNFNFVMKNVTVVGGADMAGNPAVIAGADFDYVILYNMTTPPAGGPCMQWNTTFTTDMSAQTDFNSMNFVLAPMMNMSCLLGMTPPGAPLWFSEFETMALINFTSLNMSDPATGPKLAQLPDNMQLNITQYGQFGDSRIYFNTSYFQEFNTTANITMYHLPFTEQPTIVPDAGAAGVNGSIAWAQGVGEGNLTFVVNGFSGYNETDSVKPLISVISPANGSTTKDLAPLVNISINSTGTPLSYVSIVVSSGSQTFIYNATDPANVTNTANCNSTVPLGELYYCTPILSNLTEGSHTITVTAVDFGGAAGNSNTSVTTFSISTVVPIVTLNSPATGNITNSGTMLFNWSVTSTISSVVSCNLTINGTVNQSNIVSNNGTWTNTTVTGLVNGTYSWNVSCNDSAGNIGISTTTNTFIVDNVAPVVTLLYPANNTVTNEFNVTAGNVSLRFNVTDNVASLVTCTLAWGTGVDDNVTFTNVSANGSPFPAGNLAGSDGPTQWFVNCTDTVGNTGTSVNFTFIRDTVAPVINSISLNDTYVSTGQSVFVTVNATDATTNVTNVTANGVALTHTGGSEIWNGTVTLSGSNGAANITVVALDNASNSKTNYTGYVIDNVAPVITLAYPTNGASVNADASGNVTVNFTVTEANISSVNMSIDGGVFTNTSVLNGSVSYYAAGISPGNHSLVLTAVDNASLSGTSTTSFVMVAPINATEELGTMQGAVGNTTLTNVTLYDSTGTDQSANESFNATTVTLRLVMDVNASDTLNATVSIPGFNGSSANWANTGVFNITTDVNSTLANDTRDNSGESIMAIVIFTNMSGFLPDSAYINGTVITFQTALNGMDVLYIADDAATTVYKLPSCSGSPPTTITLVNMCYVNTSSNVSIYVPHLSGAALANDTVAPIVAITVPANNTVMNNSYFTLSFNVTEANPATSFCWYNVTNSTASVASGTLTASQATQTGTKYVFSVSLSGLRNNSYNVTINCTDTGNLSMQVRHNFTVTDIVPPIASVGSSVSGSSVTITASTDETAECRYSATDVAFSNMTAFTTTNATSHSVTISSLANGAYTYYVRCKDANGINMTTSSSTAFTIAVSAASSSSSTLCTPSWSCTAFSTCSATGIQTRTCVDVNACGVTTNKPDEVSPCVPATPCVESWSCVDYSPCSEAGYQTRVCSDAHSCGTSASRPVELQRCTYTAPLVNITTVSTVTITGGAEVTIPSIAAGAQQSIDMPAISITENGVSRIVLSAANALSGVKVTVVAVGTRPSGVTAPTNVTVLKYLQITAANIVGGDLDKAVISFQVSKSQVTDAARVKLARYVNGAWVKLNTVYTGATGDSYTFQADTPGFSYFAVIEEPAPTLITPQGCATTCPVGQTQNADCSCVKPKTPPGDYTVFIVIVLLVIAAAYWWYSMQKPWHKK